jgi:hypothetical protein
MQSRYYCFFWENFVEMWEKAHFLSYFIEFCIIKEAVGGTLKLA